MASGLRRYICISLMRTPGDWSGNRHPWSGSAVASARLCDGRQLRRVNAELFPDLQLQAIQLGDEPGRRGAIARRIRFQPTQVRHLGLESSEPVERDLQFLIVLGRSREGRRPASPARTRGPLARRRRPPDAWSRRRWPRNGRWRPDGRGPAGPRRRGRPRRSHLP